MPSLRPCLGRPGYRCPRLVRGAARCQDCAPYGWPKTSTMPQGWGTTRANKLKTTPNCERCGVKATTVDHIQARAFGGTEHPSNLQSLCRRCATEKDHLDRERGKRRAAR